MFSVCLYYPVLTTIITMFHFFKYMYKFEESRRNVKRMILAYVKQIADELSNCHERALMMGL